jgi:hypothetical protein
MSEQVQISRWSEFLRRVLSLKGNDETTVSRNVSPVVLMEDFTLPELRTQGGMRSWSRSLTVALQAGQQAVVQIVPPVTGDRLYVIEGIWCSNPTLAMSVNWGTTGFDVLNNLQQIQLISRYQIDLSQSGIILQGGTIAAPNNPLAGTILVPAGSVGVPVAAPFFPFVVTNRQTSVAAGAGFKVVGQLAASALTVVVCGYDRVLQESEL